ncbi:class I adenylate-forming enzyme family protein [Ornithinimicrobium faecis]|uniref:class I adenylate-forming enzyme family protein n=1 Tax=Ornithinimicrobium faecis TaxID=2934158 RepID=UPI0021189F6D|nr:AMP-binding protein [Ornithinimicrobium sp. HY1745]
MSRAGARFADRVAVEGPEGQRTFAELADRVTRLANGLLALGLQPGDRVLDLQSNSVRSFETDLAIRAAGLVRAALNYRLHETDWARIASDSGARGLVYDARFQESAADLIGDLPHVVVIGDGPGTAYETVIETGRADLLPSRSPDTLCGLHYSSGTTGHPKGAQRTHRNWVSSMVNMTHDVLGGPPRAEDSYVHAGPITHTSGLFVLPFLVAGARQLILPQWDESAFVEAVSERGATHTALVPTMVARLLASADATAESLAGLRMLGYAGAPMTPEQMRRAYQSLTPNLVQYYGLVEAIPPVTVLNAHDHARGIEGETELLSSAGRAALGVEIAIVDEDGQQVPIGEVGEVISRGDHVMAGYWNAERRSDLGKSVVEGWLHTGDLGRLGADGHLWLIDRKGDMIISGGYNIYPREVEEVISQVPGVAEVAVLGITDADWGQRVVALVRPGAGAEVTEDAVRAHCARAMASYKKPKDVHIVQDFPLNATGKIAKKVLRAELEGADKEALS